MPGLQSAIPTRGVVFIHCCPSAVAPHVEWAIASVLGRPCRLEWVSQPAAPGQLRAEVGWTGPVGTASAMVNALRAWPMLKLEITEDQTAYSDGERLAYLPGRGLNRRTTTASGDVVVAEERLHGLLARARSAEEFAHGLHEMLGTEWDVELEPYRLAGDGSPVTLMHKDV